MKCRIVSSFGLALVLVFSLQNSSSALAAQVEPSESDVLDVIVNYQNIVSGLIRLYLLVVLILQMERGWSSMSAMDSLIVGSK